MAKNLIDWITSQVDQNPEKDGIQLVSPQMKQNANNAVTGIKSLFSDAGQNIVRIAKGNVGDQGYTPSLPLRAAAATQRAFQPTINYLEKPATFADTMAQSPNIAAKIMSVPAGIAQGLVNTPQSVYRGGKSLATDVGGIATGNAPTPQAVIAHGMPLLEGLTNLLGIGSTAGVAANLGEQGFKQALISGAKTGAGFGAATGAMQGLKAGENASSVPSQVAGAIPSVIQGGLTGAVVGGALSGLGWKIGDLIDQRTQRINLDKVNQMLDEYHAAREAGTLSPEAASQLAVVEKLKRDYQNAPSTVDSVKAPKNMFTKIRDATIGDSSIRGSLGVIANDGPVGQQISKKIEEANLQKSMLSGGAIDKLHRAVSVLKPEEIRSFSDVAEGKSQPISVNQAMAVDTWKQIAAQIHTQATEIGMDIGKIENYFPHFSLSEKGQPTLDSNYFPGRTTNVAYGNLTKSRTGAENYDTNPRVLFDYIDHAYSTIVNQKMFGVADKDLYDLAKKTNNPNQVATYLDQILGKNQPKGVVDQVSKTLTGVQSVTKLGPLSSLTNLTQNISTAIRTDIPTVTRTIGKIIANPDESFSNARKAGEITSNVLEDYTGGGNIVSKWIHFIGMEGTEKFNRVVAVNSGMDYASKMAQKALGGSQSAIRELDRLGISLLDVRNGLTEDQLLKAGRQISQETQFSTSPGDLPYGWKTPAGKVATQFKSFAYKQTGFLKDQSVRIAQEAAKGNLAPLATTLTAYGIVAPVIGEIISDARSVFQNKKRTSTGGKRYVENILAATSFGLLDSLPGLAGQYGESGVASTLAGPTVGTALQGLTAYSDAAKGVDNYDLTKSIQQNLDPSNKTSRLLLKQIPAVGQTISNTFVPNSYIQNQTIGDTTLGVNNGLNKSNERLYQDIKKTDPQAASNFKINNQQSDQPSKNIIAKLMGQNRGSAPTDVTKMTKAQKQAQLTIINEKAANGMDLTPDDVQIKYLDKYSSMPEKTTYEKSVKFSEGLKQAKAVFGDQYASDATKKAILDKTGISPQEVQYNQVASGNDTDQAQFIQEQLVNLDPKARDAFLLMGRSMVGNTQLVSDNVIGKLEDAGVVSKEEGNALKRVSYVRDNEYTGKDAIKIGTSTYKPVIGKTSGAVSKIKVTAESLGAKKGRRLTSPKIKISSPGAATIKAFKISTPKLQSGKNWRSIKLKA